MYYDFVGRALSGRLDFLPQSDPTPAIEAVVPCLCVPTCVTTMEQMDLVTILSAPIYSPRVSCFPFTFALPLCGDTRLFT